MGKFYCTECGAELDDSSLFCSKCGTPTESGNTNIKSNTPANTNKSSNNLINTILKEPKIIAAVGIVLLLVICVFAFMGSGDGDLVYVTDVIFETRAQYDGSSTNDYGNHLSAFAFKIIPKETLSGVTSFRLTNCKITYENGETDDLGTITFNNKNTYLEGNEYTFYYKYYINPNVYKQKVHISADIVVDTLDGQNKKIGHLDYDTTAKAWSANYS